MKKVAFSGTVEEYMGKKLATPISFSGEADNYDTVTELKASEDFPSDNEILKLVNTKKVTSAKAQAYQKATKDQKATYEASPEYQRKNLIDAMLAMKKGDGSPMYSLAEAEAFAGSKT